MSAQPSSDGRDAAVIEHFFAGGELLASQLPSVSNWSPEMKLAAAVLGQALVELRDHSSDIHYRRRVAEGLEWVNSDDASWPFSFLRLCELFGLEREYVRSIVRRWQTMPARSVPRQVSVHRHAA